MTSAHIPTGKLQRKRRLVSARILFFDFQIRTKITAAQPTHYRQAKGNSRNLLTIAIHLPYVNTRSRKTVSDPVEPGRRTNTTRLILAGYHHSTGCGQLRSWEGVQAAMLAESERCFYTEKFGSRHSLNSSFFLQPPERPGGEGTCGISRQPRSWLLSFLFWR